ncbi:MAG: DNA-processing protein DprA [Solirubrobacterales bacterium]
MSPRACPDCRRRGALLADLAGHIERSVGNRAGERARDLLALDDERLAAAVAPGESMLRLRAAEAAVREPDAGAGWSTCAHSSGLPAGFDALGAAAPRALYGVGESGLLTALEPERAVTIVGARRCGAYGREVAFELGRSLAAAGMVVVSGMALGVDSAAHEGALAGGGSTLAVLGPGADRAYPRSAQRLYARIRSTGAVISELPAATPTFRWTFPARNRLMAALTGVTVVVEAAERSGSLITAEMATDCGRTVGAVPGPVNSWRSSGTNRLLADGAAVIRDGRDVLDLLLGPGATPALLPGPRLTADGRAVLMAVEAGAGTADAAATGADLSFSATLVALARLERDGYVRSDHAGRWSRTAQAPPARDPPPAA